MDAPPHSTMLCWANGVAFSTTYHSPSAAADTVVLGNFDVGSDAMAAKLYIRMQARAAQQNRELGPTDMEQFREQVHQRRPQKYHEGPCR
jgi:hypothetical protein